MSRRLDARTRFAIAYAALRRSGAEFPDVQVRLAAHVAGWSSGLQAPLHAVGPVDLPPSWPANLLGQPKAVRAMRHLRVTRVHEPNREYRDFIVERGMAPLLP